MYHFCTYFDRHYLGRALVMYKSLLKHSSEFHLYALCFDSASYNALCARNLPNVTAISRSEFERGDAALVAAGDSRTPVEYYWTCTPSLPLYVMKHHPEVDLISYVDADICFYETLDYAFAWMGTSSILIHGHRYAPEHQEQAETSGIYNVGLAAFRRDVNGLDCLHWWREQCIDWCYARAENGRFGDQKYLDDWPERFPGVCVLTQPGAGLAPWNLSQYRVHYRSHPPEIDHFPLIFYHFQGFRLLPHGFVIPAQRRYRIPKRDYVNLYLPYAEALWRVERELARSESRGTDRARLPQNVLRGLIEQRIGLVRPRLLGALLWTLCSYLRAASDKSDCAASLLRAGNRSGARRKIIEAVSANPFLLLRTARRAVLIESIVGPSTMRLLRNLKRFLVRSR